MNNFFLPNLDQPVLDQLKAKVLVLRRLVLGKGVVHVEAIELDLLKSEGPVDKDPAEKVKNASASHGSTQSKND